MKSRRRESRREQRDVFGMSSASISNEDSLHFEPIELERKRVFLLVFGWFSHFFLMFVALMVVLSTLHAGAAAAGAGGKVGEPETKDMRVSVRTSNRHVILALHQEIQSS